jgi:hypothetical protein
LKAAKDQIQHRQSFHDHPRSCWPTFIILACPQRAGYSLQSFIFSKNKGFSPIPHATHY